MLPQQRPEDFSVSVRAIQDEQQSIDDSDADEIDDAAGESDPESEADEDLPLEMDDGRNASKVITQHHLLKSSSLILFFSILCILKLNRKMKWKLNILPH